MKNEIIEVINNRRSIKRYKSDAVARELIDEVISAGISAASGRNLQCPIVLAITDKATRDRLSAANAAVLSMNSDPFYNAPVVLVVLVPKTAHTGIYDGSLVMGNMMLAADALGLGSCWIHRAREVFEKPEWQKLLASLGLEGEYEGVGNLILGYPDCERPAPLPRRENRVFYI